jgi:hypothetical protein
MKAFPNMTGQQGMDLRDYFAAKVLQSLINASATLKDDTDYSFDHAIWCGVNSEISLKGEDKDGNEFTYTWAQYYADEAYEIANAMMQARERI